MIVFKTILKILNKLKGMLILYTVMLLLITVLNQTAGNNMTNFEEVKPDVVIINNDSDNYITNDFIKYIENHSNIKDIDSSDEEKISDAIFYRDVNYVIYIPENFGNDLLNGKTPNLEYKSSKDVNASYSEMLVKKYIKTVLLYKDNYSGEELINKVNEVTKIDTNVELKTSLDTREINLATRYFDFLNYAFLAGCVYCISMILSSLKEEGVKKRTIISSYNYKKYNAIVLLSNGILVFAMWILYMILSFILFKDLMFTANGIAYMINSFIYAICSLTIGILIGNITQNKNAIGGIINVIALGTSFLCGCFVPFEYLPSYVLKIAHFLPTYYFTYNNSLISEIERFSFDKIEPLIINCIIILLFSALFVFLTNVISKKKQKID